MQLEHGHPVRVDAGAWEARELVLEYFPFLDTITKRFSLKCSSNPHERCGMVRTWLPSLVLLGLVVALVLLTNPTLV